MEMLTGLPWWVLFPLALVAVGAITFGARVLMQRHLGSTGSHPVSHAGPLMPTLGALFAFLSAFVIATEWTAQAQADSVVSRMSTASARLAWASTAPGAETARIQVALSGELDAMSTDGWDALRAGRTSDAVETESFRQLEQEVRDAAYSPAVSTSASSELLASIDDLSAARRELANTAERSLPLVLFAVLGLTGIALAINAVTLTIQSPWRSSLVIVSVVVIVAVDLALLLVLAAPFRGTLQVAPDTIERVAREIGTGFFQR